MKYSILLLLSAFVMHTAKGEFDPRITNGEIYHENKFNPHLTVQVFGKAVENSKEDFVNRCANAQVPSKQEVLFGVVESIVPAKKITDVNLPIVGNQVITQRTVAKGLVVAALAALKNAHGKDWASVSKGVAYDFLKDLAIEKIRTKIDPLLHQVKNTLNVPCVITHNTLVQYVANRTVNWALDESIDCAVKKVVTSTVK